MSELVEKITEVCGRTGMHFAANVGMNYERHYNTLIERARGRVLAGYKERHHVLPKCIGGTNAKDNLVTLTGREHYVAHQLLVKMYPQHRWLAAAAVRMARQSIGSRAYEWLRKRNAAAVSARHRGKVTPEKTKRLMSEAQKGIKKKPLSDEHKALLSLAFKGRVFTDEWRAKISAANKGKAYRGRRIVTEEHRKKIAAANTGKIRSPEIRAAMSAARKGRIASDEAKKNMSVAMQGRVFSEEHRRKLSANKLAFYAKKRGAPEEPAT